MTATNQRSFTDHHFGYLLGAGGLTILQASVAVPGTAPAGPLMRINAR